MRETETGQQVAQLHERLMMKYGKYTNEISGCRQVAALVDYLRN